MVPQSVSNITEKSNVKFRISPERKSPEVDLNSG